MAWTIYAMLLQKKTTLITKSSGTLAGIVITRRDIVPRLRRKTRPFICLPPLHGITPSCQPAPLRTQEVPLLRNYYRSFRPPGACLLEATDYECPMRKSPSLQSQSFRYGQSIFCLPKFSDFFEFCLHWVSVVCA